MVQRRCCILAGCWLSVFLAANLLTACGPGLFDFVDGLGGGYRFVSNNDMDTSIWKDRQKVIASLVVDHQFDERFVVALRLKTVRYHCSPGSYYVARVTGEVEYWGIDKRNGAVFSSPNWGEFLQWRQKLHVPDGLALDRTQVPKYMGKINKDNAINPLDEKNCVQEPDE